MAQAKRIVVSMPNNLLQELDHIVRRETGNRSAFVREAVAQLIEERRHSERLEGYRLGYERTGMINRTLAEEGMEQDAKDLQNYENYLMKKES